MAGRRQKGKVADADTPRKGGGRADLLQSTCTPTKLPESGTLRDYIYKYIYIYYIYFYVNNAS